MELLDIISKFATVGQLTAFKWSEEVCKIDVLTVALAKNQSSWCLGLCI